MTEIEASKLLCDKAIAWGVADKQYKPARWMIDAVIAAVKIKAAPPYPADVNFVETLDSWIPCSERLPEPYTEVMVWPYPTDYCMTAEIDHTKTWTYNEYVSNYGNERTFAYRITHWMPLPAAPKGE